MAPHPTPPATPAQGLPREGLGFLIVVVVDSAIWQRLLQLDHARLRYFGVIQVKRGELIELGHLPVKLLEGSNPPSGSSSLRTSGGGVEFI